MMARHWFASSFGSTANERKRQAPNPALSLLLQDVFGFFPGWATSPVFFAFREDGDIDSTRRQRLPCSPRASAALEPTPSLLPQPGDKFGPTTGRDAAFFSAFEYVEKTGCRRYVNTTLRDRQHSSNLGRNFPSSPNLKGERVVRQRGAKRQRLNSGAAGDRGPNAGS